MNRVKAYCWLVGTVFTMLQMYMGLDTSISVLLGIIIAQLIALRPDDDTKRAKAA
jgi:hypothetical protein